MTLFLTSHLCSSRASSLLLPHVVQSFPSPPQRTVPELRVATCGSRGGSWPRPWRLCVPQCGRRRRRWSTTSWAACPGQQPSWSGTTSRSTWTDWWASSSCRVGTANTGHWAVWRNLHVCCKDAGYSVVVIVISCVVDSPHGDVYEYNFDW